MATFGTLSDRLTETFRNLRTKGRLTAADVDGTVREIRRALLDADVALPVVVKPARSDNSMGVSLVADRAEVAAAVAHAKSHSSDVLVETYVPLGREVRCGVVEVDGGLVCQDRKSVV